MTFEHVGWLVINILLPFFLPLLGLLSFKILPLPAAIEVRFSMHSAFCYSSFLSEEFLC